MDALRPPYTLGHAHLSKLLIGLSPLSPIFSLTVVMTTMLTFLRAF